MQPQYPTAPQYPQQPQTFQPAYPQQPYAQPAPQPAYPQQPAQQQYPAQGYAPTYPQPQYAPPAPPAPPLPAGSLDSFYQQPSASGGPSFKFKDKPIGTYYEGFVTRPVTDTDIRAQTDNNGNVQTYRDGRPKFVMVVPMTVQPSPEFPEGTAGWWVKGQARDELARAMSEAGAPAGAPEAGAWIRVTLVGQRQIPGGFNPAYQYRVDYRRPQGVGQNAPAATPPSLAGMTGAPAIQATRVQAPSFTSVPGVQQTAPPIPAPPAPTPAPQPAPVAAAPASAVSQFTPEQQALFAKLTGQQPQPAS